MTGKLPAADAATRAIAADFAEYIGHRVDLANWSAAAVTRALALLASQRMLARIRGNVDALNDRVQS
jgi:hypothetical protein